MKKFEGKVFLELGTSTASVDIVNYAKKEGAKVIVTDYLPTEKSAAKQVADETYMISTIDIDAVAELVREKNVDGIFSGVNETNIKAVCAVAEKTGLPCYFTKEQWDLCQNKAEFKALCEKHGVPIAKPYAMTIDFKKEDLDAIEYPVIVKPVDLRASMGIHICHNEEELIAGFTDAYEKSYSHHVIIEKYIVGDEISATYTFVNGEVKLSMLSQMYYNQEQEGMVPLPDAYIYPSQCMDLFMEKANDQLIEMLKATGIKNGSMFVTGIANSNEFAFIECGLRMAGTIPYIFVKEINGINIMELMTEYAINGEIADPNVINLEDPTMKGKKCCLFSLINGGGKIYEVNGLEEASKMPGVIKMLEQRHVGDEIVKDGTLRQIQIRFYIVRDTIEEVRETIQKICECVSVKDEAGNNMLLKSSSLELLK